MEQVFGLLHITLRVYALDIFLLRILALHLGKWGVPSLHRFKLHLMPLDRRLSFLCFIRSCLWCTPFYWLRHQELFMLIYRCFSGGKTSWCNWHLLLDFSTIILVERASILAGWRWWLLLIWIEEATRWGAGWAEAMILLLLLIVVILLVRRTVFILFLNLLAFFVENNALNLDWLHFLLLAQIFKCVLWGVLTEDDLAHSLNRHICD